MATPNPSERVPRNLNGDASQQMEMPSFSSPGEMVTIYNFGQPFTIHKEVACYSPVLRAAFASNFIEGQTQTYTLNVGANGGLQLVVQWLYGKAFKPCLTQAESESYENAEKASFKGLFNKLLNFQQNVIDAWIIADYLQLPRCQNLAIDAMNELQIKCVVPTNHFAFVYNSLPRGSRLSELVFEQCRLLLTPTTYKQTIYPEIVFPHAYLFDCVVADRIHKEKFPTKNPFKDKEEFKRRFHVPEE